MPCDIFKQTSTPQLSGIHVNDAWEDLYCIFTNQSE